MGQTGQRETTPEYGADKSLRDNEKWSAVDLARPTQKNRRERYVLAGGEISPCPINREPFTAAPSRYRNTKTTPSDVHK